MDRSFDPEVEEFLRALARELAGRNDELLARRHVTAAVAEVRSMRLRRQRARVLVRKIAVAAAALSILSTGGLAVGGVLPTPLQGAAARAADAISLPISVPYPHFSEAPDFSAEPDSAEPGFPEAPDFSEEVGAIEPVAPEPVPRPTTTTPKTPTTTQPAIAEVQKEEGSEDCESEAGGEACKDDDGNRNPVSREAVGGDDDDEPEGESLVSDADREGGDRAERQRGDVSDRVEDESSGELPEDDVESSAEE